MKRRHYMKRRDALGFGLAIAAALALGLPPLAAQAQGKYPERPIRLVVPFAAGGGTDIMGRRFAGKISLLLGQNVFVENRGGAGGTIGTAEVARARPDGYTLLVGTSSTHAINPTAMENLSYDPVKDFAPIAVLGVIPMVIAVHPSVPAKTLRELVARVKATPGKYSFGSAGIGSINHLTGELFKKQAGGLDIVHVPYKGAGAALLDLIAGQIPIAMITVSSATAHYRSGKVRVLATFSGKRSKAAPDIATAVELGMPGMLAYTFNIILAPAGTPKPIINQLHQATMRIMADNAFQKDLESLSIEPVTDSDPEKATQFIRDELAKWAPIIKGTGMKAK